MKRPLWVAAVGLVVASAYVLRILVPNHLDPSILAAFGEAAGPQTEYAREKLGEIVTRPELGHDGRFFFISANDPWLLAPEENAAYLDRPIYRSQRMAYPMLASMFGLLGPRLILWGMVIVNLLAVAAGTWATSRISILYGGSPWLGLAFPLNFGVISEIDIGGAGALSLAAGVGALFLVIKSRPGLAGILLSVAALAREAMILLGLGWVLGELVRRRKPTWALVIPPVLTAVLWHGYIQIRLARVSGTGAVQGNFAPPFSGIFGAVDYWLQDPTKGALAGVILLVLAAFAFKAWRDPRLLAWAALPFAAFAVLLSVNVWREPYDLARAVSPVLTVYPLLILLPATRADAGLATERTRVR